MTLRLLKEEEFDKFMETVTEKGLDGFIPAPEICQIVIAEEEDKLVGFRIIQCVIHASSLWVDPSLRKKGLGAALCEKAEKVIDETLGDETPHYVFTDGKMEGVIKELGYEQLPWKVWVRGRRIKAEVA